MTVDVSDVLKLPSMRGATLLTKSDGLKKPVTAVSVLEYSQPTSIQRDLSENIKYLGNELVLTSFASVPNDISAQCRNIIQSASRGETGTLLFYVGILMPKVDPELIKIANRMDYVLILMPPLDMSLSYSGVISDIMQAVFLDHMNNPIFAIDMLEKISQLPDTMHSIDTVMRMLSDRLHIGIALFDLEYQLLKSQSWPRKNQDIFSDYALAHQQHQEIANGLFSYWEGADDGQRLGKMRVLLVSDHKLDVYTRGQITEALQIALNLWGQEFATNNKAALLGAIIDDRPIRMRRLGEFYHLDLSKLNHMWLIPDFKENEQRSYQNELFQLSSQFADLAICEHYDKVLFLIPMGDIKSSPLTEWGEALSAKCAQWGLGVPVWCHNTPTADAARKAFNLTKTVSADASLIFPEKKYLTLGNLNLAEICRQYIRDEDQAVNAYLSNQLGLFSPREQEEWIKTLGSYLLDADQQITATSQLLYVHPNTVKYRLAKIGERLGFPVGQMPESWSLFVLCGLLRLVNKARS
ncbi:MAG: PucR family transcriptional regulator [Oenococcus sp.]|uniref:PucR family transcriptional regulator n=1 Tax=Oenococcus sp. TaxID=1979414 RepID=UPI0039EB0E7B